jgi:hypothetical protein
MIAEEQIVPPSFNRSGACDVSGFARAGRRELSVPPGDPGDHWPERRGQTTLLESFLAGAPGQW